MKQNTAMQELIDWVNSKTQLFIPTKSQIIEKATELLKKEEEQIKQAVDKTIDAYHFYVESPHNPPPMNGNDYFNQTYQ